MSGTRLISLAVSLLLCASVCGRELPLGLYSSPKGVGVTLILDTPDGREMNLFTLRTDFYGVLGGRTRDVGAAFTYTHDYAFLRLEDVHYGLCLHAGAGGMIGYTHDFEKGVFGAYDRALEQNPGWTGALAGNIGLRVDFARRLTLDVGLTILPGIHVRSDSKTGVVLVSFYRVGIYHAFYPQINLMYRF